MDLWGQFNATRFNSVSFVACNMKVDLCNQLNVLLKKVKVIY